MTVVRSFVPVLVPVLVVIFVLVLVANFVAFLVPVPLPSDAAAAVSADTDPHDGHIHHNLHRIHPHKHHTPILRARVVEGHYWRGYQSCRPHPHPHPHPHLHPHAFLRFLVFLIHKDCPTFGHIVFPLEHAGPSPSACDSHCRFRYLP